MSHPLILQIYVRLIAFFANQYKIYWLCINQSYLLQEQNIGQLPQYPIWFNEKKASNYISIQEKQVT